MRVRWRCPLLAPALVLGAVAVAVLPSGAARAAVPPSALAGYASETSVRAAFVGGPPPGNPPLTAQAVQVGPPGSALAPIALHDDGAWPDSAAGDGTWSGALPLPAGLRLPLRLDYRAGTDRANPARGAGGCA